jgi:hypothetical protein
MQITLNVAGPSALEHHTLQYPVVDQCGLDLLFYVLTLSSYKKGFPEDSEGVERHQKV